MLNVCSIRCGFSFYLQITSTQTNKGKETKCNWILPKSIQFATQRKQQQQQQCCGVIYDLESPIIIKRVEFNSGFGFSSCFEFPMAEWIIISDIGGSNSNSMNKSICICYLLLENEGMLLIWLFDSIKWKLCSRKFSIR